jgi:glyoxylase-like metal-dependent hydrolase (beta-lactamase superfamily II)
MCFFYGMKLTTINAGRFKLDGGAMFGVVPKPLWERQIAADDRNRCTWAMRCLLLATTDATGQPRLLLTDTGAGDKQDAKFFGHYDIPMGPQTLVGSLQTAGYEPADVTDVLLTHLHFDHAGGAVRRVGDQLRPTFPNATYWVHRDHWQTAINPNPREKATFLDENIYPIYENGQMAFLDEQPLNLPGVEVLFMDGHTEKMALPKFNIAGRTVVFCADLIPSVAHIPVNYVMGYDVRPLTTMDEKTNLLNRAAAENWILVFDHDANTEAVTVTQTEKGVRINERGTLVDFLN